jgi:hypothetical protein
LPKRDPELAALDRQAKAEEEASDLEAFIDAYERAVGERLEVEDGGESPDYVCRRPDGSLIGVELTQVRRSPGDRRWQAILDYQDEMHPYDTFEEIERIIQQKGNIRPKFRIERNILMVAVRESEFDTAVRLAKRIFIEDLEATGFEEIWLADFQGIFAGAHRGVRLFGLYPEEYRVMTERSIFDQKPYG